MMLRPPSLRALRPRSRSVLSGPLLKVLALEVFLLRELELRPTLPETFEASVVVPLQVPPVSSDLSVAEDMDLTVASSDPVVILIRTDARSVSLEATLVLEEDSVHSEISRTEQDALALISISQREVFAEVAIANSVAMVAVLVVSLLHRTLLQIVLAKVELPEVVASMAIVVVALSEVLVAGPVLEVPELLIRIFFVVILAVSVFDHLLFPVSVVVDLALPS